MTRLNDFLGTFSGDIVLIYAALPREANLWAIIHERSQFRYALPRVHGRDGDLECRVFTNRDTDLSAGAYGIEEPRPDVCPLVPLADLDLLIVPALALTPQGDRLGKGGGYYDRLLADPRMRAKTIGVCFDCQLFEQLPVESHDRRVDVVITETNRWDPGDA